MIRFRNINSTIKLFLFEIKSPLDPAQISVIVIVQFKLYSFVLCSYLLPDRSKGAKQKTSVIKRDCNPKWNHTFIFEDVSVEDLADRGLELTIWDHDILSSNDFLGGNRLNLGTGKAYIY